MKYNRIFFVDWGQSYVDFELVVGRFRINFNHWRRPLRTQHHLRENRPRVGAPLRPGRPRPGRRIDFDYVLGNGVGPWRLFWVYTRSRDGEVLGRTIEWCWRPKSPKRARPSRCKAARLSLWDRLWAWFFQAMLTEQYPAPHRDPAAGSGAGSPALVTESRDEDGTLSDRSEQPL